jgi:hypothetical protein
MGTAFQPSPARAEKASSETQRPAVSDKSKAPNSNVSSPKKRRIPPDVPAGSFTSTAASTKPKRDPFFADRLKARSGERCELTGVTTEYGFVPEGAHIFGLATASHERAGHFWKLLCMFWEYPEVEDLRAACQKEINHMANGIFMNILAHRLWDQFDFYFEVVDASYQVCGKKAQYTIKIRFPKKQVHLINYSKPLMYRSDGRFIPVLIQDGDEFTFKTDNYHDCPLPDPNLLKIRALLTKCCFLKAGGESKDPYISPDLPPHEVWGHQGARLLDYGDYIYSDDESTADGSLTDEESTGYLDDQEMDSETPDRNLLVEAWLDTGAGKLVEGDVNEEGELASEDRTDGAE